MSGSMRTCWTISQPSAPSTSRLSSLTSIGARSPSAPTLARFVCRANQKCGCINSKARAAGTPRSPVTNPLTVQVRHQENYNALATAVYLVRLWDPRSIVRGSGWERIGGVGMTRAARLIVGLSLILIEPGSPALSSPRLQSNSDVGVSEEEYE